MEIKDLHPWKLDTARAKEMQLSLAGQVRREGGPLKPEYIAGADISVKRGEKNARAAVVVLNYPGLEPVETRVIEREIGFPYIPGYLSFREAPLVLEACRELDITPDLFLVDGQGIAHPRRMGLAAHLGLFLDIPTIGCAKSRLCGEYKEPALEAGSFTELTDKGETIGAALRTRRGVKPVFVSIGNRIDLKTAMEWIIRCCRGYRLPEPLRLAHQAAGRKPELAGSMNVRGR